MRTRKVFKSWNELPLVLDLATAAIVLGLNYENAAKLAQQGKLPAFKVGRLWKMSKAALREYVGDVEKEA